MSSKRRAQCNHPTGMHRVKRYLTERGKFVWRCTECPSTFNALFMINGRAIRCGRCDGIFQATPEKLGSGEDPTLTNGTLILCLEPLCDERKLLRDEVVSISRREVALNALASKMGAKIHTELSRSESEQEAPSFPTIAGLIQEDNS